MHCVSAESPLLSSRASCVRQEGFVAEDDLSAAAEYTRENDDEQSFVEARRKADAENAVAQQRGGQGGAASPADPCAVTGAAEHLMEAGLSSLPVLVLQTSRRSSLSKALSDIFLQSRLLWSTEKLRNCDIAILTVAAWPSHKTASTHAAQMLMPFW